MEQSGARMQASHAAQPSIFGSGHFNIPADVLPDMPKTVCTACAAVLRAAVCDAATSCRACVRQPPRAAHAWHGTSFHRCIAAQARHGRHASLHNRCCARLASAGSRAAIARVSTGSRAGHASASRHARIATYSTVHGPTPGSAGGTARNVATSACGSVERYRAGCDGPREALKRRDPFAGRLGRRQISVGGRGWIGGSATRPVR